MLRFWNYDIVFQEVPGEVTLAINITNCPIRCKGCHSPHLTDDVGDALDEDSLSAMLEKYGKSVTCVCFMGGDAEPEEVARLARYVRACGGNRLKTAWYSGKAGFPPDCSWQDYDYVKLGPYVESMGGLNSPGTNQRFFLVEGQKVSDVTHHFHKTHQ